MQHLSSQKEYTRFFNGNKCELMVL